MKPLVPSVRLKAALIEAVIQDMHIWDTVGLMTSQEASHLRTQYVDFLNNVMSFAIGVGIDEYDEGKKYLDDADVEEEVFILHRYKEMLKTFVDTLAFGYTHLNEFKEQRQRAIKTVDLLGEILAPFKMDLVLHEVHEAFKLFLANASREDMDKFMEIAHSKGDREKAEKLESDGPRTNKNQFLRDSAKTAPYPHHMNRGTSVPGIVMKEAVIDPAPKKS